MVYYIHKILDADFTFVTNLYEAIFYESDGDDDDTLSNESYFTKQDFYDEDLESIMQIENEKLLIAFDNVFEMNSE